MGPLTGFKIIELVGIGPGPFCGMMLADMGAEVVSIERAGSAVMPNDVSRRGRRSVSINLKNAEGVETLLKLCEGADAIFEGFRPGVVERLGVGPEQCMARNSKLVYGRMTGWGQDGPLASRAGHDINYIALSGALHAIGPQGEKPTVPLNLIGDFGGGGMLLAFGLVCAVLSAQKSGKGQVVDAAMVDGASVLMSWFFTMRANNMFSNQRGTNLLDGGAPFYDTYETSDGKYIAVGAIEPQFYAMLVERMGMDAELFAQQMDFTRWSEQKEVLTATFKTRTRDQWTVLLEDLDACFSPILEMSEAPAHPHNQARNTFIEIEGLVQPAPAPRFSGTSPEVGTPSRIPGQDTTEVLADFGFSQNDIEQLQENGAI